MGDPRVILVEIVGINMVVRHVLLGVYRDYAIFETDVTRRKKTRVFS